MYIYDWIQWILQWSWSSIYAVWWSITWTLSAQTDLQNALDAKANKADVLEKTNTTAFTPTWNYNPATKKYVDDEISWITFPVTSVNGQTWAVTVNEFTPWGTATTGYVVTKTAGGYEWQASSETVVSGDAGVTYTIKVSNSDPASWTPATTITLVP